jgi:hypothetical protein
MLPRERKYHPTKATPNTISGALTRTVCSGATMRKAIKDATEPNSSMAMAILRKVAEAAEETVSTASSPRTADGSCCLVIFSQLDDIK